MSDTPSPKPNETIILRFHAYDPLRAEAMLGVARQFAAEFIDRPHGGRKGCAYSFRDWACLAYWTKARAVVVRSWEVPRGE